VPVVVTATPVAGFVAAGGVGIISSSGSPVALKSTAAVGVAALTCMLKASKSKPTPITGRLPFSAFHPDATPHFGKAFCLMKIGKI
jgi:hypothetical protein